MGNVSINLSLANIWRSWYLFRAGKKLTKEIDRFQYNLERNIFKLYQDLNSGNYQHSGYKNFTVYDSKKRKISVSSVRDRVVHQLMYEYLVPIYDKTFDYDVWSCRENKGLLGAISRTQKFLRKYSKNFIWRGDIKKFFDNVDHKILKQILARKIRYQEVLEILDKIIDSYSTSSAFRQAQDSERERDNRKLAIKQFSYQERLNKKGIPIGNLTSQIFANIYLNEFDRFVRHNLKPQAYLRYGDDFIIICCNKSKLTALREKSIQFLKEKLNLCIKPTNEVIIKPRWGLKFLGMVIYPKGRKLNKGNLAKIKQKLSIKNISSYAGLMKKHSNYKIIKKFNWQILEKIDYE